MDLLSLAQSVAQNYSDYVASQHQNAPSMPPQNWPFPPQPSIFQSNFNPPPPNYYPQTNQPPAPPRQNGVNLQQCSIPARSTMQQNKSPALPTQNNVNRQQCSIPAKRKRPSKPPPKKRKKIEEDPEEWCGVPAEIPTEEDRERMRKRRKLREMKNSIMKRKVGTNKQLDKSNMGFKMLSKIGWKDGSGLGKNSSGRKNPVQTEIRGKQGLGFGMDERVRLTTKIDFSSGGVMNKSKT